MALLRFPDTYTGLFRALASGPATDRKETLPLPLDFIGFLEALVLDTASEVCTVAFAGSVLAMIWSSLRFSDAGHVRWLTLVCDLDHHVIRGIAFRTKMSKRGMPFALQARGLIGF